MAKIGLKYPVASELTADTPTYGTGFIIGKAIAANVSIDANDNILYADDSPAESDAGFAGGSIELGVDDLTDTVYATLLGHDITDGVVTASTTDVAPNFGIGFYTVRMKSGSRSYKATVLYKVQFAEPSDEAQTKAESIEWNTPTIEGTIMALPAGEWKKQKTFTAELDAIAFIEALLNVGLPVSKTALGVDIADAQALTPATYTAASYAVVYYRLQQALAVNTDPDASQAQVDLAEDNLEAAIAALVTV
jgi:phi13 family phage major tail protein